MKLSLKAQASIDTVIEKFKTGDLGEIVEIARIKLDETAPASKWSFSNRIIAYIQAGELDCRGYRQWIEADRNVKKGSQAVYIISPRIYKEKSEEDGKEEIIDRVVGYNAIPVFRATDTDGDGDIAEYAPLEFPALYDLAEKLGVRVTYLPTPDDRFGDCNAIGTVIRLGTYGPAVFFHELAHAVHAKTEGPLSKGKKARQEIIAEFIAAVLMEMYGYSDHSGNAWGYIKKFAKDPLIAISSAMKTVEEILRVLEINSSEGKEDVE